MILAEPKALEEVLLFGSVDGEPVGVRGTILTLLGAGKGDRPGNDCVIGLTRDRNIARGGQVPIAIDFRGCIDGRCGDWRALPCNGVVNDTVGWINGCTGACRGKEVMVVVEGLEDQTYIGAGGCEIPGLDEIDLMDIRRHTCERYIIRSQRDIGDVPCQIVLLLEIRYVTPEISRSSNGM